MVSSCTSSYYSSFSTSSVFSSSSISSRSSISSSNSCSSSFSTSTSPYYTCSSERPLVSTKTARSSSLSSGRPWLLPILENWGHVTMFSRKIKLYKNPYKPKPSIDNIQWLVVLWASLGKTRPSEGCWWRPASVWFGQISCNSCNRARAECRSGKTITQMEEW